MHNSTFSHFPCFGEPEHRGPCHEPEARQPDPDWDEVKDEINKSAKDIMDAIQQAYN